jgi:hypothetical protein
VLLCDIVQLFYHSLSPFETLLRLPAHSPEMAGE